MNFLKRHPFPIVADFDRVVAVSFAFPEAVLRPLVPRGLEIDGYEGLGFVAMALVWTRRLRPAGFPGLLGRDFFLAGYRVFTRFHDESGRRLRGLKILGSETDKRSMVWLGNLMTGYRYHKVKVNLETQGSVTRVRTFGPDGAARLDITFDDRGGEVPLPAGSPFPDWRTARRFAGPMPFTFSPHGDGAFVVVEGSRESWTPRPVALLDWKAALFDEPPLQGAKPIPANAFAVSGVSYRWERGRVARSAAAA